MSTDSRFLVLTDLLLGAVYADARLAGEEKTAVRRLLAEVLGSQRFPLDVALRIQNFDPSAFDLEASAGSFLADPAVQKRHLLELVAAVFDADREVDFAEDAFMRALAEAIGMEPSEYADLTLEYELEDAREVAELIVSIPPPIPPPPIPK